MPSRLSSLLVRDGLVGVKRMEKAFQRQVIYGGSLDTILLEMGLVPDERLTQYLSLASGLPPASRVETNVFDADAVRRCPEESAYKHRVVPLCLEGDALRVLVCDPVDMILLEELADVADLPIQPLIVPEYRWHVVFARAFGSQAPARFAALAKQIDAAPVTAPVGKARTVIVDEPREDSGADHVVVDVVDHGKVPAVTLKPSEIAAQAASQAATVLRPISPESVTMRFAAVTPPPEEPTPAAAEAVPVSTADQPTEPLHPPRTTTKELSVRAYQAAIEAAEAQRKDAEQRRRTPSSPPETETAPITEVMDVPPVHEELSSEPLPVPEAPAARIESAPGDAVIRSPISTGDTARADRNAPMSAVVAREALQVAEDRDRVFLVLLRALRSRARWAGLMTVQGGAVIGRLALAEALVDVASVGTILIPLDGESAFRTAVTSQRPFVGEIATGDRDIDGMIERMGGTLPPSALLLPIVLRDRVVALAVAHRIEIELGLADVAELLPLAEVAAEALGRLIVRHKAAGYRAPEAPPAQDVVRVSVDDVATKRVDRPKAGSAWRIPTAPEVEQIETGTEMDAEPPKPAAELLDAIENSREGEADPLYTEAVDRAGEIVPLLAARFPGKLRVDRYQVSGRALRAAQYGPLLELVVRLGPPATDIIVEKMGDTHRDARFYATVCAAELRPRSAVYALVERLFDSDFGVRSCAIEALVGYPLRDLDAALARARHALHSEDPERVLAAATAVTELGDTTAIPDLLDTVGRDSRRAEHARRALCGLTKQDFGTSERKWRKWWDDHRTRNRIEWMIESLTHKEQPLRQSAAEDLRRLTGEHFGYHHDLPKRDREVSQQKWQQWWQESGRRRFARDEDERTRATATLPALRRE